jgi:TatD DNase family protein
MTLSLEEASHAVARHDRGIAWGVGCHPGDVDAQKAFDPKQFAELIKRSAVVGEIGLDKKSQVPFEAQVKTFRTILEIVSDSPRLVSIHSNHATAEVLDELDRRHISVPVLHWWSGSRTRTKAAVHIGCYFSVNPRIAQYSLFSMFVPLDRIFIETDRGYDDSPGEIPAIIESTELIVAAKYEVQALTLRRAAWSNLSSIMKILDGAPQLPETLKHQSENVG